MKEESAHSVSFINEIESSNKKINGSVDIQRDELDGDLSFQPRADLQSIQCKSRKLYSKVPYAKGLSQGTSYTFNGD